MNDEGSRAAERLTDRSVRYLLDASIALEHPKAETEAEAELALKYGETLFTQINSLLKVALDRGDTATFRRLESGWLEIPDVSMTGDLNDPRLEPLVEYREVQSFGLAMWAVHLSKGRPIEGLADDAVTEVLRLLSSRFQGIEDVFNTYDRASNREENDSGPWTNWFLSELPEGKAHFIPTSPELLFTALLFGAYQIGVDQVAELNPREWFGFRKEEIERLLLQLREQKVRWAEVLGLAAPPVEDDDPTEAAEVDWEKRIMRLESLIDDARGILSEKEREGVRTAPLDPTKVDELKSSLLKETAERRVVRHVFSAQGALRKIAKPPKGLEGRVARNWIPKNLLTPDSHVMGIDMAGRDLARANLNEEMEQLLGTFPQAEPRESGSAEEMPTFVRNEIEQMREMELAPTLILLPITWRLREALGLHPVGVGAGLAGHPLVPPTKTKEFAGIFEDVPVMDAPQVSEDVLWIVDLADAASFLEWPSEQATGVQLELKEFSAEGAAEFLAENPKFTSEKDPVETENWLQEHVLFEQRLCWTIEAGNPDAARAVMIPEPFVFRA
jgi:hypothetical protein